PDFTTMEHMQEQMGEAYDQAGGGLDGVLAAADVVNPAYHAMVAGYETSEAIEAGDYKTAGKKGTQTAMDVAATVGIAAPGGGIAAGGGGLAEGALGGETAMMEAGADAEAATLTGEGGGAAGEGGGGDGGEGGGGRKPGGKPSTLEGGDAPPEEEVERVEEKDP